MGQAEAARIGSAARVQPSLQVPGCAADAAAMSFRPGPALRCARWLRCLLAVALLVACAGPAAASDPDASVHGRYRGQCRRLTKQIRHYQKTILPLAIDRGDVAWERATNAHIKRLWNQRADLCPEYGRERARILRALDRIRAFNAAIARAGRAAARYFTGGAVP